MTWRCSIAALAEGISKTSGILVLLIITSARTGSITMNKMLVFLLCITGVMLLLQPWLPDTWKDNKVRQLQCCRCPCILILTKGIQDPYGGEQKNVGHSINIITVIC